jgi:hypothetical protein
MIQHRIAEKLASRMLAEHGVATIWDFQVAAAIAYDLGDEALAASLIQIGDAAEQEWLRWHAISVA